MTTLPAIPARAVTRGSFRCSPLRPGDNALGLVEAVATADPSHFPTVTTGTESVRAWFYRKPLSASWLAFDDYDSTRSHPIGHVGLHLNDRLADGSPAPAGRNVELTRLIVHPDHRRRGIAEGLIREAHAAVESNRLWLTTLVDSPAFEAFLALGWGVAGRAMLVDDTRPGAVLVPDVAW